MAQNRAWSTYTDADKAKALVLLDLYDGDLSKTAGLLRMPQSTLREWADGKKINEDVVQLRRHGKQFVRGLFEDRMLKALSLLDEKLEKASAQQLAWIAATFLDKTRLIDGEATEISEHRMGEDQLQARVAALLEEARQRQAEGAIDVPATVEPLSPGEE